MKILSKLLTIFVSLNLVITSYVPFLGSAAPVYAQEEPGGACQGGVIYHVRQQWDGSQCVFMSRYQNPDCSEGDEFVGEPSGSSSCDGKPADNGGGGGGGGCSYEENPCEHTDCDTNQPNNQGGMGAEVCWVKITERNCNVNWRLGESTGRACGSSGGGGGGGCYEQVLEDCFRRDCDPNSKEWTCIQRVKHADCSVEEVVGSSTGVSCASNTDASQCQRTITRPHVRKDCDSNQGLYVWINTVKDFRNGSCTEEDEAGEATTESCDWRSSSCEEGKVLQDCYRKECDTGRGKLTCINRVQHSGCNETDEIGAGTDETCGQTYQNNNQQSVNNFTSCLPGEECYNYYPTSGSSQPVPCSGVEAYPQCAGLNGLEFEKGYQRGMAYLVQRMCDSSGKEVGYQVGSGTESYECQASTSDIWVNYVSSSPTLVSTLGSDTSQEYFTASRPASAAGGVVTGSTEGLVLIDAQSSKRCDPGQNRMVWVELWQDKNGTDYRTYKEKTGAKVTPEESCPGRNDINTEVQKINYNACADKQCDPYYNKMVCIEKWETPNFTGGEGNIPHEKVGEITNEACPAGQGSGESRTLINPYFSTTCVPEEGKYYYIELWQKDNLKDVNGNPTSPVTYQKVGASTGESCGALGKSGNSVASKIDWAYQEVKSNVTDQMSASQRFEAEKQALQTKMQQQTYKDEIAKAVNAPPAEQAAKFRSLFNIDASVPDEQVISQVSQKLATAGVDISKNLARNAQTTVVQNYCSEADLGCVNGLTPQQVQQSSQQTLGWIGNVANVVSAGAVEDVQRVGELQTEGTKLRTDYNASGMSTRTPIADAAKIIPEDIQNQGGNAIIDYTAQYTLEQLKKDYQNHPDTTLSDTERAARVNYAKALGYQYNSSSNSLEKMEGVTGYINETKDVNNAIVATTAMLAAGAAMPAAAEGAVTGIGWVAGTRVGQTVIRVAAPVVNPVMNTVVRPVVGGVSRAAGAVESVVSRASQALDDVGEGMIARVSNSGVGKFFTRGGERAADQVGTNTAREVVIEVGQKAKDEAAYFMSQKADAVEQYAGQNGLNLNTAEGQVRLVQDIKAGKVANLSPEDAPAAQTIIDRKILDLPKGQDRDVAIFQNAASDLEKQAQAKAVELNSPLGQSLRSANTTDDVVAAVDKNKGIIDGNTYYSKDKVQQMVDAARSDRAKLNDIPEAFGTRERVAVALDRETTLGKSLNNATSVDEALIAVKAQGGIDGSNRTWYNSDKVKQMVEAARNDRTKLNEIPQTGGLRREIGRLLDEEARPGGVQPVVPQAAALNTAPAAENATQKPWYQRVWDSLTGKNNESPATTVSNTADDAVSNARAGAAQPAQQTAQVTQSAPRSAVTPPVQNIALIDNVAETNEFVSNAHRAMLNVNNRLSQNNSSAYQQAIQKVERELIKVEDALGQSRNLANSGNANLTEIQTSLNHSKTAIQTASTALKEAANSGGATATDVSLLASAIGHLNNAEKTVSRGLTTAANQISQQSAAGNGGVSVAQALQRQSAAPVLVTPNNQARAVVALEPQRAQATPDIISNTYNNIVHQLQGWWGGLQDLIKRQPAKQVKGTSISAINQTQFIDASTFELLVKKNMIEQQLAETGQVDISYVKQLLQEDILKPEVQKTDSGYIFTTGKVGSVFGEIEPGKYNLSVTSLDGVDITLPKQIEIGKSSSILIPITLKEGTGKVEKTASIKELKESNEGATQVSVVLTDGKKALPFTGIQLVLSKAVVNQTINLNNGWNLVTLNTNPEKLLTASSLSEQALKQGGYIVAISTLEDGAWKTFVTRGDKNYSLNDFIIQPGKAYFIKAAKRSSLSFDGEVLDAPVKLNLSSGWNAIGVPAASQSYLASGFINSLNKSNLGADTISKWDSGLWDTFVKKGEEGFGDNFSIVGNQGMILKVKQGGEYTP